MSDLSFAEYLQGLDSSLEEYEAMGILEKESLKDLWNDELRKREAHQLAMQQATNTMAGCDVYVEREEGKADLIRVNEPPLIVSKLRDAFQAKHLSTSTKTTDIHVYKNDGTELHPFDELGELGKSRDSALFIKVQAPPAVPPKYAVKIRPWVGYGEIEPVPVEVSSVEELKQAALDLINSMPGSSNDAYRRVMMDQLKLYHCKLDENGLPKDVEGRRKILDVGELESPLHGSHGVVWVWVSERTNITSSPQSIPVPEEPCSPFIVRELASVKFGELPEVYNDHALQYFLETWNTQKSDPYVQLILAIPGSGKSRTVKAAAEALDIPHCRVKFLEGGKLETISDAIRSAQKHTLSYDDWKERLGEPIQSALKQTLVENGVSNEARAILHVDEIQTLMGSTEVTRETWNGKQDPFNLVMPALCFKLVQIKEEYPNLYCVLTGTNFFAKLVVSPWSARPDYVALDGTFPVDWVMDELIKKYFKIPEDLMELLRLHVEFLSWNRRAIQHYLEKLKITCVSKRNGDNLSAEDLEACKDAAFSKWTTQFRWPLGVQKQFVSRQWH